eukprot:1181144-Prorocentrum_minimum.AAC.2
MSHVYLIESCVQPTLEGGDGEGREWVLVNKLNPKLYKWTRGDVVVFKCVHYWNVSIFHACGCSTPRLPIVFSPHQDTVKSIRRLLALDGDWIIAPHTSEVAHVPQVRMNGRLTSGVLREAQH